jgi:lysophospholipase L1-like esterase
MRVKLFLVFAVLLGGGMAYFAKLGANNIVEQVIVAEQAFVDLERLGSKNLWVETSYTGSSRGLYAGPGRTFNPLTETFTTAALDTSVLGNVITPADARLGISDAPLIAERSNIRLRFLRPIDDSAGYNFRHVAPAARVRFSSNATTVELGLKYTGLSTRTNANSVTQVLVDGAAHSTFSAESVPGTKKVTLSFNEATTRLIELVWPYADAMDFLYLRTNAAATVSAPPSRPARKICTPGDSITHGLLLPSPAATWPFQLGALLNAQVVNMGYGGNPATANDVGLVLSDCTDVVYMIGHNNAAIGQATATFQAIIAANLQAMRLKAPAASIYAVSPLYATTLGNLAGYRTAMQNAVTAVNDPKTHYVDGLSLMPNNANRLVDGAHPNALGASEVAAELATRMPGEGL